MVQRIRLRGHVIRLYGLSPNSSRSRPKACPTCGQTYNDGSHRKCFYLCCEFDDCFDCVINRNKFYCHIFRDLCKLKEIKREKYEEDKILEPSSSLVSSTANNSARISGVTRTKAPPEKSEDDKAKYDDNGGGGRVEVPIKIKQEPVDKDKNADLRIEFIKILPKQWLPLVILERVEGFAGKIKEEPQESREDEVMTTGRRRDRGISCERGRRPGRPRGGGGTRGMMGRRGSPSRPPGGGRRRLRGRRRSTRLLSSTKGSVET